MYSIESNVKKTAVTPKFRVGDLGFVEGFSSTWDGTLVIRLHEDDVRVWQIVGVPDRWDETMTMYIRPLQDNEVVTITNTVYK